jgi:hypothetical protein
VRTIFFIPTRDDTCVRTEGGIVEVYFATVEDLKIALWRALIYPAAHKRQLNDLENGFRASIAVTEAHGRRSIRSMGHVTPPMLCHSGSDQRNGEANTCTFIVTFHGVGDTDISTRFHETSVLPVIHPR